MHKRECTYANCKCDQCDLIETRRKLDQHIKKRRVDSNKLTQINNNNKNIGYILSQYSNNKLNSDFLTTQKEQQKSSSLSSSPPPFLTSALDNSIMDKPLFYDSQSKTEMNSLWKS